MTHSEVMQTLEQLGTAQARKTYARHGGTEPMFGVSHADLGTLAKKIKRDQTLAESLWQSGNLDARVLATKIADPKACRRELVEEWLGGLTGSFLVTAVANLAVDCEWAVAAEAAWIDHSNPIFVRAGWTLTSLLAMRNEALPQEWFAERLTQIEREIQSTNNAKREGMHNALLSIGMQSDELAEAAIAVATRIGPVIIDHGDTNCKTPDTIPYIRNGRARTAARKSKSSAGKRC